MKVDLVRREKFSRTTGGNVAISLLRGRITHLLILSTCGFSSKDYISATLRHRTGTEISCQRVPFMCLSEITDAKFGIPSFGKYLSPTINESDSVPANETSDNYVLNAVCIPIGHLTLQDGTANYDISIDLGTAFGSANEWLNVYTVSGPAAPDHLLQYIPSNDLEAQHAMVRELYIYKKDFGSLFFGAGANVLKPVAQELAVRYDIEGESFNVDTAGMGAVTSIFSELNEPSSFLFQVMKDFEALPSNVYVSVQGEKANEVSLLLVKEKMLPLLTSISTINNAKKELARVEQLEKVAPEQAKAYRHAGQIEKSEEIKARIDNTPTPVAAAPAV